MDQQQKDKEKDNEILSLQTKLDSSKEKIKLLEEKNRDSFMKLKKAESRAKKLEGMLTVSVDKLKLAQVKCDESEKQLTEIKKTTQSQAYDAEMLTQLISMQNKILQMQKESQDQEALMLAMAKSQELILSDDIQQKINVKTMELAKEYQQELGGTVEDELEHKDEEQKIQSKAQKKRSKQKAKKAAQAEIMSQENTAESNDNESDPSVKKDETDQQQTHTVNKD